MDFYHQGLQEQNSTCSRIDVGIGMRLYSAKTERTEKILEKAFGKTLLAFHFQVSTKPPGWFSQQILARQLLTCRVFLKNHMIGFFSSIGILAFGKTQMSFWKHSIRYAGSYLGHKIFHQVVNPPISTCILFCVDNFFVSRNVRPEIAEKGRFQ